jgi:hypothetical protein
MSESNLLPCPFCGAESELIERDSGYSTGWDVQCNTKGCYLEFGGEYWLAKESEAIALWNNRPSKGGVDALTP